MSEETTEVATEQVVEQVASTTEQSAPVPVNNDHQEPVPGSVMRIRDTDSEEVRGKELMYARAMGLPIEYEDDKGGVRATWEKQAETEAPVTPKPASTQQTAPEPAAEPVDDGIHPLLKQQQQQAQPEIPATVKEYLTARGHADAEAFFNTYDQNVEQLRVVQQEADQLKQDVSYLDKLSIEAQNVIAMDLAGKDWKKEVAGRPSLDFTITFNKQDPKVLAAAYPGKVMLTEDDWEEYADANGDAAVKAKVEAVLESVEARFNADRDKSLNYTKEQVEQSKATQKKYTDSFDAAIANVSRVPGSAAHIEGIKKGLTREGIIGLFFEDDGVTLRPNAGTNFWLVKDAAAILGAQVSRATVKAEQDAQLKVLQRTPERIESVKTERSMDPGGTTEDKVKAYLKERGLSGVAVK